MKQLRTIAKELVEILKPSGDPYISKGAGWVFYADITGHLNGVYYSVNFHCHKFDRKNKVIEICQTTDCAETIAKLIKEIEPNAKVKLYKTSYESLTL